MDLAYSETSPKAAKGVVIELGPRNLMEEQGLIEQHV